VHHRRGEQPFDRRRLPALERQMQLQHVLEDRGLGDRQADQGVERSL
jgi:hypothetical protein